MEAQKIFNLLVGVRYSVELHKQVAKLIVRRYLGMSGGMTNSEEKRHGD